MQKGIQITQLVKQKGLDNDDATFVSKEQDLGHKSIKDQLLIVYDELSKKISENKTIEKSVYGVFHRNFQKYFVKTRKDNKSFDSKLNNSRSFNDNDIMAKTKKELLHSIFRGSNILKRDVDKAILYYNLPEFLISQMFVP